VTAEAGRPPAPVPPSTLARPATPAKPVALPRVLGPIRPRARWQEFRLLLLVALALVTGSVSLGAALTGTLRPYDPWGLGIFLGALLVAHGAQVLAGRRTDQILLPAVAMLGGISLLLMERLPQDLVIQRFFGTPFGLAEVQLLWLVGAVAVATTLAIVVRSDSWLRRYKYTWAAVGVGLLLLTFVLGTEINGQRLTLQVGPISGQPSELLKVILVVFLAGYLSENRALLVDQDTRLGPLRLPPVPYLAPMVAMWAIALGIVVVQRDLGAALLFFGVFLALLYVATGRVSLVVVGMVLFLLGSALMANLFGHIATRIDIWIDPFSDPLGAGYQVIQALHAFARGGLLGVGLGAGLPEIGGQPPIPEIHTDFPLAALGEELGIVGVLAILGIYLVIVQRGLRIGVAAADDFRSLLAIGLALVIGIQAFIIAAGNLKVLPLTGVTLPFISYGGSSLLVNGLVVGLLLALSDKGVEPPPPRTGSRWRRLTRRAA
jgi:cell division protein FtsW (lipid II flippase)